MRLFELFFAAVTIFSFATQAMESPEGKELLRCISPESLAVLMQSMNVNALNNQSIEELTLLIHSINLRSYTPKPKSKFEQIADLAIKLNLCLIKDAGYDREIGSIAMEYFPTNTAPCQTTKTELAQITRETLKNIVRLTKNPSPNLTLLEQTIHQIHSFKLKYLLTTQGLPLVIEDTTSRYKQEMLMTLHS